MNKDKFGYHGLKTWEGNMPGPDALDAHGLEEIESLKNRTFEQPISLRGHEWIKFAHLVLTHIETYTVPQYGDKGDDQVTGWNTQILIESIKRYCNRHGKNVRPGQDKLDMLKVAHYACMVHGKLI